MILYVTSPEKVGYTPNIPTVSGDMGLNDIYVTVIYTPNKDTEYKVEYYKEELTGKNKNKSYQEDGSIILIGA